MKKKQTILIISIIIVMMIIITMISIKLLVQKESPLIKGKTGANTNFDYKIIKEVNTLKDNYLISPISIAYALNILNEGAKNGTKVEIDTVLDNYTLPAINGVEDKISLANALFIKNTYQNEIKEKYTNNIQNKYNAEIIYDEFTTPDILNNWVKEKTYNMIPTVLDQIDPSFVLGIVNTIAIDIEWQYKFDCASTHKETFTKEDNTQLDSVMMSTEDVTSYFENDKAKGIIKDYKTYGNNNLEYIAIMPKGNLKDYINDLNKTVLENLLETKDKYKEAKINLNIPRYTYDYSFDNFKESLINLGMEKAFDETEANFKNISETTRLFVNKAIHKTHIEFSENGTKAAALTAFMLNESSSYEQIKPINITFNKPFLYIIKDKNTNNIWFFGTVYEPLEWNKNAVICQDTLN